MSEHDSSDDDLNDDVVVDLGGGDSSGDYDCDQTAAGGGLSIGQIVAAGLP